MLKTVDELGHIVVLYGGNSAEREVSLVTGRNIFDALKQSGVKCTLLDAADNVVPTLQKIKPDLAFIALHGLGGEDGTVQGLLQMMGIPFTGSDVQSSALAMDKYRSKLVWKGLGLPTPEFCMVSSPDDIPADYPFPCFVKATCQGSTIGTFPVTKKIHLKDTIAKALQFGDEVLIERWIEGREFSVPILNGEALPAVRIEAASGFYDYEAKYEVETTIYSIPCGLSNSQEDELRGIAKMAFKALGASGWGRIDFMQDKDGQYWLIEANTVPGMTPHSIVPQSAKAVGISFRELVLAIALGRTDSVKNESAENII